MAGNIAEKLAGLGVTLTAPPAPQASYVGFVKQGNLVYVSGQLPFKDGKLVATGLLGRDVSVGDAADAARQCAINILNQINVACEGDMDRVEQIVRLGGFVASMPEFTEHPLVINGASDFIGEVFGEKGAHARAAVGVAALPLNTCVEIDAIVAIK